MKTVPGNTHFGVSKMSNITISQNVDFGKALKRAQEDRHIRTIDIARSIKVAPNQVARWQKMKDIKLSKAVEIAAVFRMTLEEFMAEYHD